MTRATKGRENHLEKVKDENRKRISSGMGIRDGNDVLVFAPAFDCSPVLSLLCSSMQGVPCGECPSSSWWEEERMVAVSREVMHEIECGTPLSSTPTTLPSQWLCSE